MVIRDYADHAANERTFLAWLRTGIAVVAFGFLIEKFDLFALTMAGLASLDTAGRSHLEKFSGPFGFGAGHASAFSSYWARPSRFVRTGRLLDDQAMHSPGILPDLAFGVILALLLVGLSVYLIA
jgi:putative membrane protein